MSETSPRRSQRNKGGGKKPSTRNTNRKKGGDELPAPSQRILLSRRAKDKLAERGFHKKRGYSESPQKQSSVDPPQSHATSRNAKEDGDSDALVPDDVVGDITVDVNGGGDLLGDCSHKANVDETFAAIPGSMKEGEASVLVEEVVG